MSNANGQFTGRKNKLVNLNDHLFEQIERLNNEDLDSETLEREIKRADSMCKVSEKIIDNAALVLKAQIEFGMGDNAAEKRILGLEDKS